MLAHERHFSYYWHGSDQFDQMLEEKVTQFLKLLPKRH